MEKYFHSYWQALGVDHDRFLELGIHPKEPGGGFNMTAFALRMSGYANGVSKLHGKVSRKMWAALYPDLTRTGIQERIDELLNWLSDLELVPFAYLEGEARARLVEKIRDFKSEILKRFG